MGFMSLVIAFLAKDVVFSNQTDDLPTFNAYLEVDSVVGYVVMFDFWLLVQFIFIGPLNKADVKRILELSLLEMGDTPFILLIFARNISVRFLGIITALLLIKMLHWLLQKRVEDTERKLVVTMGINIRMFSFMGFLLCIDCILTYITVKPMIDTWQVSPMLYFCFEYMILAITAISSLTQYALHVKDTQTDVLWENKAAYIFYTKLILDWIHLSMFAFFCAALFYFYRVPVLWGLNLLLRLRNLKDHVTDYIRSHRATSNINKNFLDESTDELNMRDKFCVICLREMVKAKKLHCGHIFHLNCLIPWFETCCTCPICHEQAFLMQVNVEKH